MKRDHFSRRVGRALGLTLGLLAAPACPGGIASTATDSGQSEAHGDGGLDAGVGRLDAGSSDGGRWDAGASDAGASDAGASDAGARDAAAAADASAPDAAQRDAGPSDAGEGRDSGVAPDAGPAGPCGALTVGPKSLQGYSTDFFQWSDGRCRPRTAALVRNDADDPGGSRGGFLRQLTYEVDGKVRTCPAQSSDWNGWGYVVNHYTDTAATSRRSAGAYRTLLSGPHHAVHEFTTQVSPGGPVDVTIHWMFATGRDHPLFSITFDASRNAANALQADARAPYGNLNFDGLSDGRVAGVAWGDKYKFTTTGPGPVTMASPWDYTAANTIPFVLMWASDADAEMGAVETRPFDRSISGGDYGGGALAQCWGHTSANAGGGCLKDNASDAMFASWLWPFQLNQYELPYGTTSKRLAWGANYAAVGQSSYDSLGRTGLSGYPRVSYAVLVVLGKHSEQAVAKAVSQMEAVQATALTASVGQVAQSSAAGPGRTDTLPLSPAGWNASTAAWEVIADADKVSVHLAPGGALEKPVFRVRSYRGTTPTVRLGGALLAHGVDYFATVDSGAATLWLTLMRDVASPIDLSVD